MRRLSLLAWLLAAGCYERTFADGEYACGAHDECPPGLGCSADDHRCYAEPSHLAGPPDAGPAPDATLPPPATSITLPAEGTITGTTVAVTFSAPGNGVTFECRLDAAAFEVCGSPRTYAGLAGGAHVVTVHALLGGAVGPDVTRAFTVDATGATVAIAGAPANGAITQATGADYTLSSTPAGATFECRLDGPTFATCASPQHLSGLTEGTHVFAARGLRNGVTGGETAISWTVDQTPPTVTISVAPPDPSNSETGAFLFSVSDGVTTCRLDGGSFVSCDAGTASYANLADGGHSFTVRATDAAGNVGTRTYAWNVDTLAPMVTITSGPSDPTPSQSATFVFTVSDGTVSCKLDAQSPTTCASGVTYPNLALGAHTFTLTAVDAAGNGTRVPYTWTIAAPPAVTITQRPSDPTVATSAAFGFSVSDGTISCRLDGGAFGPCATATTMSYTGLAPGAHTFTVKSVGTSGYTGSDSATWTVLDTICVDASSGSDSAAGTCGAPFRHISRALAVAGPGQTVKLAAGTYSAASGETFPLAVPAGVTVLGSESDRGATTIIDGDGPLTAYFNATITLAAGDRLLGVTAHVRTTANGGAAVYAVADGLTVRNCTINNNPGYGLLLTGNDGVVSDCIVSGNLYGIAVHGQSDKLERNTITRNTYGAALSDPVDLGGGALGGAGGNTFSCNTSHDLWGLPAGNTVAHGNKWDHFPPTMAKIDDGVADIFNADPPYGSGGTIDTTGGTVAAGNCP